MVHGGAGNVREGEDAYAVAARAGIARALDAGAAVLAADGAALEAVVAAAVVLEDCEVFNAGRGSVLNEAGEPELDAAVMEGSARRAGAVAGLSCVANPVRAALAVLEDDRHVLLTGPGAERFALECGVPRVAPDELVTDFRRRQWQRSARTPEGGTIGAVARDRSGRLAAATSTGGMLGKRAGRVSDSAHVGAGTWADDATCAVSATGHGELFVRAAFASRVDALLRGGEESLASACARTLADVAALGGSGGCIAVDRRGEVATPFDTPGMPRGVLHEGGEPQIALLGPDPSAVASDPTPGAKRGT